MYRSMLVYSICNERLSGRIGDASFSIRAASGGRRGRAHDRPALQGLETWDPGVKLPGIRASVGRSSRTTTARNAPSDVKTVQNLLNASGKSRKLTVDGLIGPKTLQAIEDFQKKVVGLPSPDKRVDPRGKTMKALLRPVAGGPIPPGRYRLDYLKTHRTFGECIFLAPVIVEESIPGISEWKKRNGFFIHGRGDRGSDGCIVPYTPSDRKRLNAAVASASEHVELRVTDPFVPIMEFNRAIRASLTA